MYPHFGFEGKILVLINRVPSHCFYLYLKSLMLSRKGTGQFAQMHRHEAGVS